MAGYNGYSMSNNAVYAYSEGEMPISKWTKTALLRGISENYGTALAESVSGWTLAKLRDVFLTVSSWHHTSCKFNRTDFYSINADLDTTIDQLWESRSPYVQYNFSYPEKKWAEIDERNGSWGDKTVADWQFPDNTDAEDNSAEEIREYELNNLLYTLGAIEYMTENMPAKSTVNVDGYTFRKSHNGNLMMLVDGEFKHIQRGAYDRRRA